ncbi:MAG: DUF3365 domain-containing protein [Ghiorsea sp.]|nr:DUF3365 domain-containing protein [Ghiorsea sp.]
MKLLSVSTLILASLSLNSFAYANDEQALKQEAMSIVKQFGGSLKPQLVKAMKQGGPVHAIEICTEKAPAIAQKLSQDTGWTVKRVSLKSRNAKTAAPDAWEEKVLKDFDKQQASGAKVGKLTASSLKNGTFRFMKAQGVQGVCLTCHGSNIKPNVRQALLKRYPNDNATGYSLGQVRGAFTLTKVLDEQ